MQMFINIFRRESLYNLQAILYKILKTIENDGTWAR